jgi:hypothetical protein
MIVWHAFGHTPAGGELKRSSAWLSGMPQNVGEQCLYVAVGEGVKHMLSVSARAEEPFRF